MSTIAVSPPKFSTAQKAAVMENPADASIFPLVLTYALATVLIFLAARGAPSFLFPTPANGASADADPGPLKNVLVVAAFANHDGSDHRDLQDCLAVCSSVPHFDGFASVGHPLASLVSVPDQIAGGRGAGDHPNALRFLHSGAFHTAPADAVVRLRRPDDDLTELGHGRDISFTAGIDYKNSTVGIEGIFPQKNICAVVTVELLTAGFCYPFRGKMGPLKRLAFIVLLVSLILATLARTGWILLILVVGFIVLLKGLHRLRPLERFTVAWFLPAVGAVLIGLVYVNSAAILHLLGKDPTLSGRTGIWSVVFLAIVKRPLVGFGWGAFWIAALAPKRRYGWLSQQVTPT